MYLKKSFITIIVLVFLTGCTNDSTSDLIDDTTKVENITYTNDIKTIIDLQCISCHADTPTNGAPMSLTTYDEVKEAVIYQGLIDLISKENGQSGLMPAGGPRMLQSKIDLIIQWKLEGFQP